MADKLGLTLGAYQKIEYTGKSATETLLKIAGIFGISLSALIGEEEESNIDLDKKKDVYKIPLVNSIPASGFVRSFEDMISEDYIYTTIRRKGLFALTVKGDSMAPSIKNKDLVVLDSNPDFQGNGLYAIIQGSDEATLKRVEKTDGGYWCLPENPAYPPLFVPDKNIIRFYKVFQVIRTVQ